MSPTSEIHPRSEAVADPRGPGRRQRGGPPALRGAGGAAQRHVGEAGRRRGNGGPGAWGMEMFRYGLSMVDIWLIYA